MVAAGSSRSSDRNLGLAWLGTVRHSMSTATAQEGHTAKMDTPKVEMKKGSFQFYEVRKGHFNLWPSVGLQFNSSKNSIPASHDLTWHSFLPTTILSFAMSCIVKRAQKKKNTTHTSTCGHFELGSGCMLVRDLERPCPENDARTAFTAQ